jgi:DNA-binding response OmpR family regulator
MGKGPFVAGEKILVVDDDLHTRQALQAAFESAGYVVRCEADGRAGVTACGQWRPDLVLMDVLMPGELDGHAAGIEIKYDEGMQDIPLLYLSADQSEDSRSAGLGHGAEGYVTKPFHVDDLLRRVGVILRPLGEPAPDEA